MQNIFVYKKRFLTSIVWVGILLISSESSVFGQELVKPDEILKSKKWSYVFQEADEINRELIWLVTAKRPVANKTLFGKILRAKNQFQKIKLKDKSRHACDNYDIKVFDKEFKVYEFCQKQRSPDLLATVEVKSKTKLQFTFQGQNYSDVIGINAAIVSPKVECELEVNQSLILQTLKCQPYKFARNDQVVDLALFAFDRKKNPTISVEGKVLDNMLPYSTLSVVVPEVGKIKIKEVKLRPDSDEYDPTKVKKKEVGNQIPAPINPAATVPVKPMENSEPSTIPVTPQGELISPREEQNVIFTPEGEKIIKQSEPDMIELKPNENPSTR